MYAQAHTHGNPIVYSLQWVVVMSRMRYQAPFIPFHNALYIIHIEIYKNEIVTMEMIAMMIITRAFKNNKATTQTQY